MKAFSFARRSLGAGASSLLLLFFLKTAAPLAAQNSALQAVLQKSRAGLRAANYAACRAYADSALLLAQNTPNQTATAARVEAWTLKGRTAYALDRYAEAQAHFDQARALARTMLLPSEQLVLEAEVFAAWNLYYASKIPQALTLADSVLAWEGQVQPCEALAYAHELKAVHEGELHLLHKVLPHLNQALTIRETLASADSLQLYQVYKWFVSVYTTLSDLDRALQYSHRSLALLERHGGNPLQKSVVYHQMGFNYERRGEAERSLGYRQQSYEQIRLLWPEVSPAAYSQTVAGLALGYAGIGDTLRADSLHLLNIRLAEVCTTYVTPIPLCTDLHNYGRYLQARGKPEQALRQYRRAIQLALPLLDSVADAPFTLAHLFNGMLLWHYRAEQYGAARLYFDSINTLVKPRLGAGNPLLTEMYSNYAVVLGKQGLYAQAITIDDSCLQILHATDADPFDTWLDPPTAYVVLWNRSEDYRNLFQQTGDSAHLRLAWQGFDRYVQFLDFLRASYRDEDARLGLAADNRVAYEYALTTLFASHGGRRTLDVRQKAFEYITKSSGLTLADAVARSGALDEVLPPHWATRERRLRQAVVEAEKEDFAKRGNRRATMDVTGDAAQRKVRKAKQTLYRFLDSLKMAHPRYYQERYQPDVPSLADLQQVLKEEKRGFLAYFLGAESVFGLWATADTSVAFQVAADSVAQWVAQLRKYVAQKPSPSIEKQKRQSAYYRRVGHALYDRLFGPVKPLLTRRFVVAPDDKLCYLPFQALLCREAANEADLKNLAYLGQERVITYAYSADLHIDMRQKKHSQRPSKEILVMAPFAHSNGVSSEGEYPHSQLEASGPEARDISKLYAAAPPLLGQAASKEVLMKTANQYRQLYLATHGNAELDSLGNDAWIALAVPGNGQLRYQRLTVRDIYHLSLHTDLVTLSACETGLGELRHGEGVLSMARAFAYAGTKSIAYTLWSVDDSSTAAVMLGFHQYLKAGKPKDEALWQAQQDFLAARIGGGASPYYWAGIVLIGQ